tara:strand:+ start:934 stop:1167 length:234 start_codon:yes stop_codon:yes gene_type:complete
MDSIISIYNLPLPKEICERVANIHKHDLLQPTYDKRFMELNKHFLYYSWLNKKINKKDNVKDSLLKTILEYDYYAKE